MPAAIRWTELSRQAGNAYGRYGFQLRANYFFLAAVFRTLVLLSLLVLATLACGNSVGPRETAGGLYVLDRVGGNPVAPVTEVATGPCQVAVTDGLLALQPRTPKIPQGYSIFIIASPSCEVNGIPTDATPVLVDGGTWSAFGSQLHFVSSPSNRHGEYEGTVMSSGSASASDVQVTYGGHNYDFLQLPLDQDRSPAVSVSVVDQKGVPIAGSLVVVRFSDREVVRSFTRTAEFPTLTFPGVPGPAQISIAPAAGYQFAPGQSSPRATTLISGQVVGLVVILAPGG